MHLLHIAHLKESAVSSFMGTVKTNFDTSSTISRNFCCLQWIMARCRHLCKLFPVHQISSWALAFQPVSLLLALAFDTEIYQNETDIKQPDT